MSDEPVDPRWAKILSLSVHEFRTPITVVAGYIRMLLSNRAGALTDSQRGLLEQAEKSCARLAALVAEMSELSNLEGGSAPLNRQPADLHAALREAVEALPALPDREVAVQLQLEGEQAPMSGDPARLRQALTSVIRALQREIITEEPLLVRQRRSADGGRYEVLIGDSGTLASIDAEPASARPVFEEWRGGSGLILPVARRIIEAHGGRIWGPPNGRAAGAFISFAV
jgi:signal transduction histidine kinase